METDILMRWVNRIISTPVFIFLNCIYSVVGGLIRLGPQQYSNHLKAVFIGEQPLVDEVFVVYLIATIITMAGMWLTTTENSSDPITVGYKASVINIFVAVLLAYLFRTFVLGW